MKRIITPLVSLLLLFTVCISCAKSPSEAAWQTVFRAHQTEIVLNLPENTEFAYENGTAWITVPSGSWVTGSVDLSPLSSLDGFEQIVFASDVRIETLILPTETKSAEIQTYQEPIELLDASGCASLTRLSLVGPSEKVRLPESLGTLALSGPDTAVHDLASFEGCKHLGTVVFNDPIDLTRLGSLASSLDTVCISRSRTDTKWDLSPLVSISFETLRIGNTITDEELNQLRDASFTALQLSDEEIAGIAFTDHLPKLKNLLLEVKSVQTPDILAFCSGPDPCPPELLEELDTSIPAYELKAFAAHGSIYLFSDSRR